MANDFFKFKQFNVLQDKCAMKVGTDGVLLGAWANTAQCKRALDIGSGTGLIALMLAQRSGAQVDAVELDPLAAGQAQDNFSKSKWADRLQIINSSFQDFSNTNQKFDLIVSNPPFFSDSTNAASDERTMARHNDDLSIEELVKGTAKLLAPSGFFSVIIPVDTFKDLVSVCKENDLFLSRKTNVKPIPSKPPHRVLAEFSFLQDRAKENQLVIEEFGRHQYSKDYVKLTKDFYLDF